MERDQETNPQDYGNLFEVIDPITDQGEYEQGAGNVYHVYVVKQANDQQDAGHTIPLEEEQAIPSSSPNKQQPYSRRVLLSLALALLLLVGLVAGVAVAYFTQAPTANVTIIPVQVPVTAQATMDVATGTGTPTQAIPGRALPTITLSQAMTVNTSGTGQQDAQAAHGLLTFYNGLPIAQTVSAGTLVPSSTGIEIVTDEDAMIPAASLPLNGQATVSAHALILGPGGNLAAFSVSQACCRENIYVQNSRAFTGGQLARSFPTVTRQDVATTTATLKASIEQSVQAAMRPQVRNDETLLTPLPCTTKVTSNHAIGEEAVQV